MSNEVSEQERIDELLAEEHARQILANVKQRTELVDTITSPPSIARSYITLAATLGIIVITPQIFEDAGTALMIGPMAVFGICFAESAMLKRRFDALVKLLDVESLRTPPDDRPTP